MKCSQTLTVGMEFHQSPKILFLLFYDDNINIAAKLLIFWLLFGYFGLFFLFSQKTKYFRDKTIYTFFTDNIGIAAKLYKAFLLTFFSIE